MAATKIVAAIKKLSWQLRNCHGSFKNCCGKHTVLLHIPDDTEKAQNRRAITWKPGKWCLCIYVFDYFNFQIWVRNASFQRNVTRNSRWSSRNVAKMSFRCSQSLGKVFVMNTFPMLWLHRNDIFATFCDRNCCAIFWHNGDCQSAIAKKKSRLRSMIKRSPITHALVIWYWCIWLFQFSDMSQKCFIPKKCPKKFKMIAKKCCKDVVRMSPELGESIRCYYFPDPWTKT